MFDVPVDAMIFITILTFRDSMDLLTYLTLGTYAD